MDKIVSVNGKQYRVKTVCEERAKRVRVHVWADVNEHVLPMPKDEDFGCNVYTRRGENKAIDAAWDKHNRSYVKAKRAVMEAVFGALTIDERAELGVHGKLEWSRKAGCSCGCSPGFVAQWMRCWFVAIEDVVAPAPYAGENI